MFSQYRDNLLDHARNPRCFGVLDQPTFIAHQANPSCGDAIDIFLLINDGGRIEKMTFTGVGCAISLAASSLFAEYVVGKTGKEVLALGLADMVRLLSADIGPQRSACATLPLSAFQKGFILWNKDLS